MLDHSKSFPGVRSGPDGALTGLPARLVGTALLLAVLLPMVSGRLTIVGLILIAAATAFLALAEPASRPKLRPVGPIVWSFFALGAFAALSALWAERPDLPLATGGFVFVIVMATVLIARTIANASKAVALHMAEGVCIGLALGLAYLIFEYASGNAIKIAIVNAIGLGPGDIKPASYYVWKDGDLVRVKKNAMTRNTAIVSMMLWPALLVMTSAFQWRLRHVVAALLASLAVVAVMVSPHETSKVAVIVSAAVFALALVSVKWARMALMAGWVAACLLVVPAVLAIESMKLHETSEWFDKHAKSRVGIWSLTAEKALEQPVIGVGARMTYVLGPEFMENADEEELVKDGVKRRMSRHAHNAYLQTWYELGAVGALLLSAIGIALVWAIARLPAAAQPFACATFATCMVMAGMSYGMWQGWFMALFATTAIGLTVGLRSMTLRNDT